MLKTIFSSGPADTFTEIGIYGANQKRINSPLLKLHICFKYARTIIFSCVIALGCIYCFLNYVWGARHKPCRGVPRYDNSCQLIVPPPCHFFLSPKLVLGDYNNNVNVKMFWGFLILWPHGAPPLPFHPHSAYTVVAITLFIHLSSPDRYDLFLIYSSS